MLLSTAYFPPISWMAKLYQKGEANLDLWETYSKQSYRNRCYIAAAKGRMTLSVPVKKPQGNKSITKEILIDYSENWRQIHWRSIKSAYQSSPFFLYYQDEVEALFQNKYTSLAEMNEKIITVLAELLGFTVKMNHTLNFIVPKTQTEDFRFSIHPKKENLSTKKEYIQVFQEKNGFLEDLSVLDLLFNLGPEALMYLEE